MKIIALHGARGVGKSCIAEALHARLPGSTIVGFADPIRKVAVETFGLPHEAVYGESALRERVYPSLGYSARQVLRLLGTECGRALHPDVWVKALARTVSAGDKDGVFIISDLRFENEAIWVRRQRGSLIVRITRASVVSPVPEHVSDFALPDCLLDYEYENDRSPEDGARRICSEWDVET